LVEGLIWPFSLHLDALLLSVALKPMTIEHIMLALVVATAAVPRSAAESPGTFAVGWIDVLPKCNSEKGQVLISFQSTEAFGCLHHAGGGPAQRHRGVFAIASRCDRGGARSAPEGLHCGGKRCEF
jgi:hypothetical protein